MNSNNNKVYLYAVLLPLIVVIIVSMLTVYIAVRYADQPIAESYSKDGLTVSARDDGQWRANNLGLNARLICTNKSLVLELHASDPLFEPPGVLQLWFVHSVDAKFDRRFIALLDGNGQYAIKSDVVELASGYWKIFDAKNNWILKKKALSCQPAADANSRYST